MVIRDKIIRIIRDYSIELMPKLNYSKTEVYILYNNESLNKVKNIGIRWLTRPFKASGTANTLYRWACIIFPSVKTMEN